MAITYVVLAAAVLSNCGCAVEIRAAGVPAAGTEHSLRGMTGSALQLQQGAGAVCQCEATSPSWKPCGRTVPKCIFIDLGAGDGAELRSLNANGFGSLANCPSGGQWEAILVEADPGFRTSLELAVQEHPNSVHLENSAPYMCDAAAAFTFDTQRQSASYFKDNQETRYRQVQGRTTNVNRLIYERTIPGDWVMVVLQSNNVASIGTEGVLPCLSTSPVVSLIDRLYLELPSLSPESAAAVSVLQQHGVDVQTGFRPQPAFPNM